MEGRRVVGAIAIVVTVWALLGASVAGARHHRVPRKCHPGRTCRRGTGFCNDAGRCCDTADGDAACGSQCCEAGTQACCDGNTCANLLQDSANCGSCGNACTGGKTCQNGACACPSGDTDCSGVCADLDSDPANCGACGHACGAGQICLAGTCQCADVGQGLCNGACVNVIGNPNNCGRCGNVCAAGQECAGTECQAPCDACHERVNNVCVLTDPDKDLVCNGVCVDPKTDPNNCGSCDNPCLGGDTCQNGICIGSACPAPDWHSCGTIGASTYCARQGDKCCAGAREATGCSPGTKCASNLDAYCCPLDYTICSGIWAGYPCVPPGSQCPDPQ